MEIKHPLSIWIDGQGINQTQAADMLGYSDGYMSRVMSGQRSPSYAFVQKVNEITKGSVPPQAFFDEVDI